MPRRLRSGTRGCVVRSHAHVATVLDGFYAEPFTTEVEQADGMTEPKAVVQAFYEAFSDQPYEVGVAAFLTEDVVWYVAGRNPLAGTFTGIPEILAAMRAFGAASGHSLRLDTMTLLADAHHVVAVHDATASTTQGAYRAHEVDVFHLRGEQIEAFWSFSEDQAATDRLWSSAT